MAGDAFTAGVKPGGLTSTTEVRILLCYLVKTAAPLTRQELESALLGEELVNYFELAGSLADLEQQGLITQAQGQYAITEKGRTVADALAYDLPRSVRESAVRAVIRAQTWLRKAAQHKASIQPCAHGYTVTCSIEDLGSEVFRLALEMPDKLTAEAVKTKFIENGSEIFNLLLCALTDDGAAQEPRRAAPAQRPR